MATKKVNEAKATAWTKTMKVDVNGSIAGVSLELFGLIDSAGTRSVILSRMQEKHQRLLEIEAKG